MTAFARQVSNLTSSQRISFLGTHITPCLSVCISWESITNPTSAQSRAGEWNWDYNGRRKRTRVSPDCSMPSPEVMLWSVLVDRLLIPSVWVQPQRLPLHIRDKQLGGGLAPREHLYKNSAVTCTLIFVFFFCLFMEMPPPCWYYMTLCMRLWARASRIYVFLHLMKVLFGHKSAYAVWTPKCVCRCVMEPCSGNLVESGTSRLSPCQMQQILFQYQAWVIWKHSQCTYINSEANSFLFSAFKMQSELIQKLGSHISGILDNMFQTRHCIWATFKIISNLFTVKNLHSHTPVIALRGT